MVGVVKKKGSSLSPERVAGLNSSIDFNGTKCATCTCDGENAFYITGPNMGKNLYIGKDVEPGHNPTIDYTANAGTVEIGTNIKNIGGPLTGDSFGSTIAVGERLTVGNGDYVFGSINCNNNPRAKCADIHNRLVMVGREITVGNVCNTNWYAREQQIFGCAIKIDTCLPEAQRTNACGYTTFNGNSDTVLGRNVCYNHRYQDNPGRTVIISGWSGRYCTTDSVYVGGSNRSWLVTSDNPITGVVSVQCPYGSCTSIDPLPSAQLQGTIRNAVVGTGNSIWSNNTAMLGISHITTSDPFPAYYDGTSNRANCIPANLVVIGQANTVWGEDNVAIGRNSHAHGYRNYVIGTDSYSLGNSNVVIGSASCARFNGTSGADTQASRVFGNVVIGVHAKAGQYSNVAIGYLSNAYCWDGVAIGHCAQALNSATAVGTCAKACNTSAVALGHDSSALGVHSTAVGYQACAPLNCSTALGFQSCAECVDSVAIGPASRVYGCFGVALGTAAKAYAAATALGVNAKAYGDNAVAVGNNTLADGTFAIAMSTNATAHACDIIIGVNSCATDNCGYKIGIGADASTHGTASIAIGRSANAAGACAVAIGYSACSVAYGVAIGRGAHTTGFYAVAIGYSACSVAYGVAIGDSTKTSNLSGTGIGNTIVSGVPSSGDRQGQFTIRTQKGATWSTVMNCIACWAKDNCFSDSLYVNGVFSGVVHYNNVDNGNIGTRLWYIRFYPGWQTTNTCRWLEGVQGNNTSVICGAGWALTGQVVVSASGAS